ncbi:6510_t:CDS:1, partial [Acaulospora colombiana]
LLTKKRACARDYLCSMFCDKNVIQVLKLQDGEDVSEKNFDRRTFFPRTNSLYIKLEGKSPESC